MLDFVDVGERSVEAYRGVARDDLMDGLRQAARDLRGARVLHINATPYGGGVSELLRSVVPLLNDLGLVADWRIISGNEAFFEITKTLHNGLQGAPTALTDEQKATYIDSSRANAVAFEEEYDFIFVHDPQPAALLPLRGKGRSRWIWRCHIDTSGPNERVWEFLRQFLTDYDAAIFTMPEFVPPDFPIRRVEIIPPAIDPLSPKNIDLGLTTARGVLDWIGIRTDRPLVTQVSRFDPWKDPMGVIAAYRIARNEFPDLQLALVGSLALDDPEGNRIYREILGQTREDRRIHVFTNLLGIGNIEVNAFQRLSSVVIQKSLREGFGLVVSEALWKGTPVVAGRAGGIPLQMGADGGPAGGILVDDVPSCANAIVELLRSPERARELGERGRERVRNHFLISRLVLNELLVMRDVAGTSRPSRMPNWVGTRDPVCGMAIAPSSLIAEQFNGTRYIFCSELCRSRFRESPERYAPRT
jgi:trehalose synthase